jgi:hypothetical protein
VADRGEGARDEPGFYSHPLGVTGFDGSAWRVLTDRFPEWRVVAEDILVDGDKIAIRSSIEGAGVPDDGPRPTLFEIFRVDGGRLAEMWGAIEGVDPRGLV